MTAAFPTSQAIVIGGGLAGMTSANTILEFGGRVVVLDKSSFCGGNSSKATSGINGSETRTQKTKGIKDSNDLFLSDTLSGGAKKPEIAKVLVWESGPAVDWLMDKFNLDLSLVARLGGHSAERTHRGKERFPGMTITYALIQMVEKISENSGGTMSRIVTKARATQLIVDKKTVIGVEYVKGGQTLREFGPVIMCSGGFGADFTSDSLLSKYRPDLMHLPTSNGEHCTGDGIKMGEDVGANSLDLEWVQVHPTGLVKVDDPDAKVKFLAAEALRGVGGLLLDAEGNRFANELGRRDYVTGEMWKNKAPFRLCLNSLAAKEIHWHCEHYKGRGVMRKFDSGADLAKEIGCSLQKLEEVVEAHYQVSLKQDKDPDGGPFPAYPNGKSWDEPSGKTGCGKKFFHNCIQGKQVATEVWHVAIVTPVIHYCMGGLEISVKSEVVDKAGKVIKGLYAAGEVAGGVHGNNRLGGSSLLDCVAFGRVAGRNCAEYMLGKDVQPTDLWKLAGGAPGTEAKEEKKAAPAQGGAAAAPAAAGASAGTYTMAEVQKHTTKDDCWVVLHGQVLDVTSFLKDHPGGELAILTFAGKDASAEFDMIHPPDVVQKYAPDAVIGVVGNGSAPAAGAVAAAPAQQSIATAGGKQPEAPKGALDLVDADAEGLCGCIKSVWFMVRAFMMQIFRTIFFTGNIKFTNDRIGLTRSAFFLIFFLVVHAVGNLHVFLGPDDFNGYGYFYVRLYWTGFGFNANIVEEYVLLAGLLHIIVGLKRTWDISITNTIRSGRLNMAISGLVLLAFMTVHLFQYRLAKIGTTFPVRPPKYLINFDLNDLLHLRLFWTQNTEVPIVMVRDIYQLEYILFSDPMTCVFYMLSVMIFMTHGILGWVKAVPAGALGIPKIHHMKVNILGCVIIGFIGFIYLVFPVFCYFSSPKHGHACDDALAKGLLNTNQTGTCGVLEWGTYVREVPSLGHHSEYIR
mmetsp:Transcript_44022/g.108446  ORF Transcript_44022/g.108446 Transcript_44022/m.108446 type:complete len:965 (-) Transcript_44022:216-3110(-)